MKTKDFLKMINCFIEKHGMKPTSTYAVVQWKEHEYHSLTMTDVDYDDHSTVHFICNDVNIKGYLKEDLRLMDVGKLDTLKDAEAFLKEYGI